MPYESLRDYLDVLVVTGGFAHADRSSPRAWLRMSLLVSRGKMSVPESFSGAS